MGIEDDLRQSYGEIESAHPYPYHKVESITGQIRPRPIGWHLSAGVAAAGVVALLGVFAIAITLGIDPLRPLGTDEGTIPPTTESSVPPTLGALTLEATAGGAIGYLRSPTILFAMDGDGAVVYREYRRGEDLGPERQTQLTPAEARSLTEFALTEGGLATAPPVIERKSIGPAGSLVFTIRTQDGVRRVEYQMPIGDLLSDDDPAVAGLRILAERLTTFSDEASG